MREKDERDEGYIAGSRHMPYRIVREFTDDFNGDQTVIARSARRARAPQSRRASCRRPASKPRPVLGGGVDDWSERGGDTVQFRRCGN